MRGGNATTVSECGPDQSCVVVGVDVGGPKKGFHAVALRAGRYHEKFSAFDAGAVAGWCEQIGASAVGIDAPCRWSLTGRARPAERQLAGKGIHSFATPSLAATKDRDFYRWMLAGAELYRLIEPHYPLFDGRHVRAPVCFETFPQAIACMLAGKLVSAKNKRLVRRELLREAGIDTGSLTNIDFVDAGLCALTADYLLAGKFKRYGDVEEGFIVVPDRL